MFWEAALVDGHGRVGSGGRCFVVVPVAAVLVSGGAGDGKVRSGGNSWWFW